MPRIAPALLEDVAPESREEWRRQVDAHGRMTNMKRTLAHSWPALRALMEWYPLRDAVASFLGDRLTTIFAYAVSAQTDCLICSTFFRRLIVERGEDPDRFELDDWEQSIVAFARSLAKERHDVADALYEKIAKRLTAEHIVALTAFGCIMLATNAFNNALRVQLDDYLEPYRAAAAPISETTTAT